MTSRGRLVDAVLGKKIATFQEDRIGVLQNFEALVVILLGKAHARGDDLQHIDYCEWPIAYVRAELTMIGVVDGRECIDAPGSGRLQFLKLQSPFIGGQSREVHALQANCRQAEIDKFDAGNGRNSSLTASATPATPGCRWSATCIVTRWRSSGQGIDAIPQKQEKRRHGKRPRTPGALEGRQHDNR